MKQIPGLKMGMTALWFLALAGCGGGSSDSGGGTPPPPTNNAPTAEAGAAQSVDELSAVTLSGTASDVDAGDTLTFLWTQTAGPSVTLTGDDTLTPGFTAPDVLATVTPVTLTFRLQVSDGTVNATDSVTVTVNDVGLGANSPPVANAGPDQDVAEVSNIILDGTASSDPDPADSITYSWQQIDGPAISLDDNSAGQPAFTSPDVASGVTETLTFELTVSDGTDTATDTVDIRVSEGLTAVTVAGKLSYEFVPPVVQGSTCRGLDFNAIETRPVRAATVQLVDGNNDANILDTTTTDDNGDYAFSNVAASTDVRIRVRAELKRAGTPGWDVEIRDNTSDTGSALGSRPLYVVQWAPFNTGIANITDADFTATTGWGGSSYTGTRTAAPLAILDQIYTGMLAITAESGYENEVFPPLDAFWSVNNTLTSPLDIDAGELTASFYRGDIDSLFLLGDANVDTEEFDDHVTMHEWGHYFEDVFSRSDSIGGPHRIGDSIDARLAFGEGWATALAAIVLQEQQYCDTGAAGTTGGFGISTESNNSGPQGWMNEMSVATFIYDLWDTDVDGTDTGSIGFKPILDTMFGPQANTPAFTTLFSFATEIRNGLSAADVAFVDSQLDRENIERATLDIWGSNQNLITTAPNQSRDVLPLYTDMPVDGSPINICTNSDYETGREGNKLAEHRYLRLTTTQSRAYNVTITTTTPTPPTSDPAPTPPDVIRDQSDPDMFIYRRGTLVAFGNSGDDNSETFTTQTLPADTYVAALQEWRYEDESASSDFPEQICFDVTFTPQ
ncbi:MAG: hypothetical protein QNJ14_09135 [Woeseiaceae bacterium]|nr:hypothetical protein [Woeseiaceae bacterium]